MDKLPMVTRKTQLREALPSSTPPSTESLRKLRLGSETAEKILKRYPDYAKAPPEYLAAISTILSTYDYRMQCQLSDIMTGVSARCKFLPTVAEIKELAYEFAPPVQPKYFKPEPDPPPLSPSARARMQKLTDDFRNSWVEPGKATGFTYRPADEIKSSSDLKSPDGPISDELRQKLIDENWPYMQQQEDAA